MIRPPGGRRASPQLNNDARAMVPRSLGMANSIPGESWIPHHSIEVIRSEGGSLPNFGDVAPFERISFKTDLGFIWGGVDVYWSIYNEAGQFLEVDRARRASWPVGVSTFEQSFQTEGRRIVTAEAHHNILGPLGRHSSTFTFDVVSGTPVDTPGPEGAFTSFTEGTSRLLQSLALAVGVGGIVYVGTTLMRSRGG